MGKWGQSALLTTDYRVNTPKRFDAGEWSERGRRDIDCIGRMVMRPRERERTSHYNLFRYCHNDPLDLTDPLGLETLIIFNDVVHYYTNPFAHVAVATTGQGLHSHGNNPDRAQHTNYSHASVTKYLAEQAKIRDTTLVRIKTTASQEKAINRYMDSLADKSTTKTDNCAVRTSDALKSAGLSVIHATFPDTVKQEALRSLHGTESHINKGESDKAPQYRSFDPVRVTNPSERDQQNKAAEMISNVEHDANPKPR